jgi:hypothetical protein
MDKEFAEIKPGKDYYYKFRDISFDIEIRGEQIKCKGNQLYIRCFVPIDFSDAYDGDEFEFGRDFILLSVLRINKEGEEVQVKELESAQNIFGDVRFYGLPREKGQNKWTPVCIVNKPRFIKELKPMMDYSCMAQEPNASKNRWYLYYNATYSLGDNTVLPDEEILWREGLIDEYEIMHVYEDNLLIIYRIIIFLIRKKLEERNLKLTEKEWVDILNTAMRKFSRIKDFSELHWSFMHIYTRWCGLTEGEYHKWP